MRARYLLRRLLFALALIVVGGCRKNVATGRGCAAASSRRLRRHHHRHPPPPPPPAPPPAPLTEEEIFQRKTLDQLNAERPLGDVFFDLDQSDIRADAQARLQANADWMKKWASYTDHARGHADSRGSSEYNLALGTRRANSVRIIWSASACRQLASPSSARARKRPSARRRTKPAGSRIAGDTSSMTGK